MLKVFEIEKLNFCYYGRVYFSPKIKRGCLIGLLRQPLAKTGPTLISFSYSGTTGKRSTPNIGITKVGNLGTTTLRRIQCPVHIN